MTNKTNLSGRYPLDVVPRPSSILKDCERLTAEHDRIAETYRDLMARLEESIYKRSS